MCLDGRSIVWVFCKVPSPVPKVKILDFREDDRGLDRQDERINLALWMGEQDVRIVEPLSILCLHKHLLQ